MQYAKKLTSKGGITIPKQLRTDLGITEGSAVDIKAKGAEIVISRRIKNCRFCGAPESLSVNIITVSGVDMCRSCAKRLVREVSKIDNQ